MAASEKPYTFQPVYAVDHAIDLGGRLVRGQAGWTELKDAFGIAGCALEKLDGEEVSLATFEDLSDCSLEELGERLQALPAGEGDAAEALPWALLLPIIMQIIQLLLGRFTGGTSPSPGPV